MLRKNFVQKKKDMSNCISIQTQTDEFLLFLTIQEKLKTIMTQYHNIENQYNEAMNKIQYLEYKNNLLESSLLETTYIFNNNLLGQNIKHLKEITDLQKLIEDSSNQLMKMQQKNVSRLIEDTQRQTKQAQQINFRNKNAGFKQVQQNSNKISQYSKPKQKVSNSKINMTVQGLRGSYQGQQSQNQFLIDKLQCSIDKNIFDLTLNEKKVKQFDSEMNKILSKTTKINPCQFKYNSFKRKKSAVNQKQNSCIVKMMKLEAELKLKNFMSQFQRRSTQSRSNSKEISTIEEKTFIYPMQQTYDSEMLDKQSSSFFDSILKKSVR